MRLQKTGRKKLIVCLIASISAVGVVWWKGANRQPTEVTYSEGPTLKIPATYYGGYPFDFSDHSKDYAQLIEVAFPGMRPWKSLSLSERSKSQKISVQILGSSHNEFFSAQNMILPFERADYVNSSKKIYGGLDAYTSTRWETQLLFSERSDFSLAIQCYYNGDPANGRIRGCAARTLLQMSKDPLAEKTKPFKMHVFYRYDGDLLPKWLDVQNEVERLLESLRIPRL